MLKQKRGPRWSVARALLEASSLSELILHEEDNAMEEDASTEPARTIAESRLPARQRRSNGALSRVQKRPYGSAKD
jgi:hypothetical protein